MITLQHYVILSSLIFIIGTYGILKRKNILMLLFSTEIMLSSINILVVAIGHYYGDIKGQIIALFVIAIAAAEVAIGLGLVLMLYKKHKTLDIDFLTRLKD